MADVVSCRNVIGVAIHTQIVTNSNALSK
jgi:hypothetical protein